MGQVGQTSLAVVPTMKGFRQKVNSESKAAARQAGRSMESEYSRTGVRAGRSMAAGFRSGTAASEDALKDLTRANAQATSAWSTANRNHANALGQVRVAQAKLAEATKRYGEDSVQAITAQERLASAQRRSEETAVRLTSAQERLAESAKALKAAQEGVTGRSGMWKQLAKDLEPVTSRFAAMRDRMREIFQQSKLGQGLSKMWDGFTLGAAKATLATFNLGQRGFQAVSKGVTNLGSKLSGAFNGFLIQHPRLNVAFTKLGDMARSFGQKVVGAGQMLGGVGKAAGTVASTVGRALGPALSATFSGLNSMIGQTAQAFTSVLGGAAVVAGGMITAALGKAVVGGFSRLSNIENAEAKMRGLGFAAADIDAAMAGASEAVDGTAFALDEMASAASVAMAAGLKPGAELNGYMKTLKNAAAAANVPLADMGQILNKTVTSGRAYTMEINQIADRGLPIWSKLQEAYGVTADEMREMVSRGEVDSATFLRVVEDMSGGVADEMGGTASSAIRNFGTALSKLGADMLQGLYPVIGPLFEALKAGVQMIQTLGAPAFEAFGEIFAPLGEKLKAFTDGWVLAKEQIAAGMEPLTAIKGVFEGIGFSLEGPIAVIDKFKQIWESLGPAVTPIITGLVGALGPLLARLPMIGGAFTGITGPVGIFVGLLITVWQQSEAFRDAVMGVFESLVSALAPVFAALEPVLATLGTVFGQVAAVIGDVLAAALTAITPLFEPLGQILAVLITALEPILALLGPLAEMLGGILVTALTALTPLFEFVGEILTMLSPIITMVADVVAQLLEALMPLLEPLQELIGAILPPLIELFMAVLGPIMELVGTILGALMPVIQGLVDMFSGLINFIVGVFTGNWEQAWNGIKQFFQGFSDAIMGIVNGIGDIIGGIYNTIMDVFAGVGDWLVGVGESLIQGFIDGVMGMFGAVGDAFGGLMDWVGGFFPSSPAKRGPLSGAGWRKLKNSGRAYMDQWVSGVDEEAHAFSLPDLVQEVDNTSRLSDVLVGAAGSTPRTLDVRVPVSVNMMEKDPERVGRAVGRGVEDVLGKL